MGKAEEGLLLVVSGSSGSGKSTVLRRWLERHPEVWFSVSCTTRPRRRGETDGDHYHFITRQQFEGDIAGGGMLEWAEYAGNLYGTPLEPIRRAMEEGRTAVLEIEVQGAMQVKRLFPDAVLIYIRPSSFEELGRRLRKRNTENEEDIRRRIEIAREEYAYLDRYSHELINDDVEKAVVQLESVYEAEKLRHRP